MAYYNLFWAVVWGVMLATCIIGMFYNPFHWVTAVIALLMTGLHLYEYIDLKRKH